MPELEQARASGTKLLTVFEGWLRNERETRRTKQQAQKDSGNEPAVKPQRTPFMPSKHMAFFR
jgi:CCR4-NOT complex subunit CAF16